MPTMKYFLPKVEPEHNQAFRCNAQKTDESMGIQLSKKCIIFYSMRKISRIVS